MKKITEKQIVSAKFVFTPGYLELVINDDDGTQKQLKLGYDPYGTKFRNHFDTFNFYPGYMYDHCKEFKIAAIDYDPTPTAKYDGTFMFIWFEKSSTPNYIVESMLEALERKQKEQAASGN